ncbi:MAG TPA: ABC transporter substrate-binding protein [Methylomirabilota bacterium]|nr:ABC transporter substrate-binding protein [Methylomirabilota bacterium]
MSPSAATGQSLAVAIAGDLSGGLSNAATGDDTPRIASFLFDGLYGLDEHLAPVPKLAADLATVSPSGLVWTIRLRSGVRFHDGSPLTADDVVQTYDIARSQNCRYARSLCAASVLASVTRIDDLTVTFTLSAPLASFATTYLGMWIESAAAVSASYGRFRAGIDALSAAETTTFLDDVATEEGRPTGPAGEDGAPTVDYGRFRADGETLLTTAGVPLPSEAGYTADGVLDVGAYVRDIAARVRAVDATFTARPIDALAAAYPFLDLQARPIGTGPFRLDASEPGAALQLVANDDYFLGPPAIRRITFPVVADPAAAGEALADGEIDWQPALPASVFDTIRGDPDLKFVEYQEPSFLGLYFNLHPESGALFVDRSLRQAVSYCFDKPATVRRATDGRGVAIYSEIPAMSWAYPSEGIDEYPMDPAHAKTLIEGSGWKLGEDGIYAKDGRRLSTVVAVRAGYPQRTRWLELVAEQVLACGIELRVKEVPFASIVRMLDVYPHINAAAPDARRPFDAYLGGFNTTAEPDPFRFYHSSECSSAERSSTFNYICYADPTVDRLIDAGRGETDPALRAGIYHQYAIALSQDLPVIYAWSDVAHEGIRSTIGTTAAGGLELDTPTWYRQVEKLTNAR